MHCFITYFVYHVIQSFGLYISYTYVQVIQSCVSQVLKIAMLNKEMVLTPRVGVIVYPKDVMVLISGGDLTGEVVHYIICNYRLCFNYIINVNR